jgi:rubredoxin
MTWAIFSPMKATAIPNPPEEPVKSYECTTCGYIYGPEVGDPDGGIRSGTAFEDLPDDWVCPDCGAKKVLFESLT